MSPSLQGDEGKGSNQTFRAWGLWGRCVRDVGCTCLGALCAGCRIGLGSAVCRMWGARGLGMGEGLAGAVLPTAGASCLAAQPLQPRLHISSPLTAFSFPLPTCPGSESGQRVTSLSLHSPFLCASWLDWAISEVSGAF